MAELTEVDAELRATPLAVVDRGARDRDWLWTAGGLAGLLVVWQLLAMTALDDTVPDPVAIGRTLVDDWSLYPRNINATVEVALKGWLIGVAIATAMGAVAVAVPWLESITIRLAVATYAVPVLAIGPILKVTFGGDAPYVAIAALSVIFTTLVGAMLGLRSADSRALDLVRALGGSPFTALRKVRFRAALPHYFAGLRISAPAAVLATMIAEWFGADRGLGVFMVSAMANVREERTWGIAIVATAIAAIGYALIALLDRLVNSWAPRKASR